MTNHGTTDDTTYDIVLFGATGFVGALTAEYLAGHAPQDLRIALAGRNRAKLEDTRRNLASSHPRAERFGLVIADSSDAESLRALAGSARVVISTVGPYFRYGLPLVEACAKAGTHYVDLSGEVLFMRESIRLYHDAAKDSGARIVHACGFDSVPSDMGMLLLHQLAQQVGEPLDSATMIVRMKGGVSGGTVDSMREQFKVTKADKELARAVARPYTLSPDPESEPDVGKQEDFGIIRTDSVGGRADGWAGPFVMAGANTRVVRRSNALLSHAYGPQLTYTEYMATGTGLKGRARSYALAGGLGAVPVGARTRRGAVRGGSRQRLFLHNPLRHHGGRHDAQRHDELECRPWLQGNFADVGGSGADLGRGYGGSAARVRGRSPGPHGWWGAHPSDGARACLRPPFGRGGDADVSPTVAVSSAPGRERR